MKKKKKISLRLLPLLSFREKRWFLPKEVCITFSSERPLVPSAHLGFAGISVAEVVLCSRTEIFTCLGCAASCAIPIIFFFTPVITGLARQRACLGACAELVSGSEGRLHAWEHRIFAFNGVVK